MAFPQHMRHLIGTDGTHHKNRFCLKCYQTENPQMLKQPCMKNYPKETRPEALRASAHINDALIHLNKALEILQVEHEKLPEGVPKRFFESHINAIRSRRNETKHSFNLFKNLFGIEEPHE